MRLNHFFHCLDFKTIVLLLPVLCEQLDHEWDLDSAEEKAVEVLKTLLQSKI